MRKRGGLSSTRPWFGVHQWQLSNASAVLHLRDATSVQLTTISGSAVVILHVSKGGVSFRVHPLLPPYSTMQAVRRAAVAVEQLALSASEELPGTMAALRLSSMEISELTMELNDLR